MAGTNKNLLLSVKGDIFPVSINKVKSYKNPNIKKPYGASFRNVDAKMDRVIFGESFLVPLRKAVSKFEYHTPSEKRTLRLLLTMS